MNKFFHIEVKDKRKARIYTGIIMLLSFIILVFIPFFSYQNPPPGQEGVLISFGEPNQGQGIEAPAESKPSKAEESKPTPKKPEKTKPKTKPKPKPTPKETKPKKVKPKIDKKVIEARNAEIALEKEKAEQEEKEKARKAAEVAERLAKAEAAAKKREAEAKAKALAEAKRKQDAEDFKNSLADSFKKGKGTGQGDGGDPGNQGDPDGDPNSEVLKGLSTGEGVIGGGLQGRGGKGPGISDNSNKTGVVVIYLCIDSKGKVRSAKYTLKGSTTSDPQLQKLALDNAKKWSFNAGPTDSTCGTITYEFKVK